MSRRADLREIDRSLARITRIARGRVAARVRSERSGVELSRAAMAVLSALMQRGGLRLSALAELADAEPAIITREMRLLTAQGYVKSQPDPSDGRARIVHITPKGKTAYQRYRDAIDEIIADTFWAWSAADLTVLRRMLSRVAEDFAHPDPKSPQTPKSRENPKSREKQ